MKYYYLLLMMAVVSIRCSEKRQHAAVETPVPEPLKTSGSIYKRVDNNLVEQFYHAAAAENNELKKLDEAIAFVREGKGDALDPITEFNLYNEKYYIDANNMLAKINDSGVYRIVLALINSSAEKHRQATSLHSLALKNIDDRSKDIESYHAACKIVYTLPMIEKYQQQLPPLASLQRYMRRRLHTPLRHDKLLFEGNPGCIENDYPGQCYRPC
jgi:hypothetical protein